MRAGQTVTVGQGSEVSGLERAGQAPNVRTVVFILRKIRSLWKASSRGVTRSYLRLKFCRVEDGLEVPARSGVGLGGPNGPAGLHP